jgi:mannose-6-phosphate isomerase-like protein (cupin superfamily)
MSSEWRPDDSLSMRNKKGELAGARRVKAALRKNKISVGRRVITSRDRGIAAVTRTLKRSGMPRGVQSYQMPFVIGRDLLSFITTLDPGTIVPEHSHAFAVLRVVIEGELIFERKTLKPGDWMFVPARTTYSIRAGRKKKLKIYYGHG